MRTIPTLIPSHRYTNARMAGKSYKIHKLFLINDGGSVAILKSCRFMILKGNTFLGDGQVIDFCGQSNRITPYAKKPFHIKLSKEDSKYFDVDKSGFDVLWKIEYEDLSEKEYCSCVRYKIGQDKCTLVEQPKTHRLTLFERQCKEGCDFSKITNRHSTI